MNPPNGSSTGNQGREAVSRRPMSFKDSMTSAIIRERVLILHGHAFADIPNELVPTAGDPAVLPPAPHETSPEVDALIQRALLIVDERHAEDPKSLKDSEEFRARYKQKIEALAADALALPAAQYPAFEIGITNFILDAAIEKLDSLPSFDQIAESPPKNDTFRLNENGGRPPALRAEIARANDTANKLVDYISVIQAIARSTKRSTGPLSVIGENLEHDAVGHICYLRASLGSAARSISSSETWRIADVRHVLDVEAPFIKQVVAGTQAIATDAYEIALQDAATICVTAAAPNACRFQYRLSLNESFIYSEGSSDRDIRIHVQPDMQMFVDPNALGLVLYNLIKNPIKLARFSHNPLPSVDIEIGPSTDGRCTSIFVRDDGIGVSYDQLRQYFTERARARIAANAPLQLAEECLLDEAWNQHVPPVALTSMILDRGASVGGGTGIGLAIANQIIHGGHQGHIQLYSHPTRGAGVQILLPNVGTDVSAVERLRITLGSLRHQLETGLPTART